MRRLWLLLLILMFPVSTAAQEICTGLLSYTGLDRRGEARENAVASSLYTEHCAGSQARSNSGFSLGLDAVVKAIPIKFSAGGSSSREKLDNFCKVYDSNRAEFSTETLDSSTVVREAVSAFNSCISLSARGIFFNPTLGTKQISVDVRRGSDDSAITGLIYDQELMECRLPPSSSGDGTAKASVIANQDTVLELGGDYVSVNCVRKPQSGTANTKVFPRAELTISTSRGSFYVPIPADMELPLDLASDIQKTTTDLGGRLAALESFVNGIEPLQLYQCPLDLQHHGGAWATWGCIGQISSQAECFNYTHVGRGNQNDWYVRKACTPISAFRAKQ